MTLDPPPGFCRPEFPADRHAWREVVEENVYNVAPDLKGATCLDIGAHIGSFTTLALSRGASAVYAYEADPRNFEQLQKNVGDVPGAVTHNCAVWRSDLSTGAGHLVAFSGFHASPTANTGGGSVVGRLADETVFAVPTISLQAILKGVLDGRPVHFLKMDCEGSEYPILMTALPALKRQVAIIAAELHPELAPDPGGAAALVRALVRENFRVFTQEQVGLANRPMLYAVNLAMKER